MFWLWSVDDEACSRSVSHLNRYNHFFIKSIEMYMNLNFRSLICVFYNFVLKCDIRYFMYHPLICMKIYLKFEQEDIFCKWLLAKFWAVNYFYYCAHYLVYFPVCNHLYIYTQCMYIYYASDWQFNPAVLQCNILSDMLICLRCDLSPHCMQHRYYSFYFGSYSAYWITPCILWQFFVSYSYMK